MIFINALSIKKKSLEIMTTANDIEAQSSGIAGMCLTRTDSSPPGLGKEDKFVGKWKVEEISDMGWLYPLKKDWLTGSPE